MQNIAFSPKNFRGRAPRFDVDRKKIKKVILYFFGSGLLFVAGVFAYFSKDLPSPGKLGNRVVVESTKIYDRTGDHILYDIHGEEKRTLIPFSEMNDAVKFATIALEDQGFYTHHGIALTSIIRAGIKDVLHLGAAQGASTITQQFIKKAVLTPEKTLSRKIKEAILSIELEQKFSKDEILGMYLNQIPYGSNAYGIEAAAQTFFGKHAKELTLDEAALLAALPQAPSRYSPYGSHTDSLKARQEYAITQMAKLGYITAEQAEEAKGIDVLGKIKPPSGNISAPHFVMYIKEYLEKKYGEQAVEQGGLKVYTTLDWNIQQAAEKAVREGAENNLKYSANNAALVAIDPKTGQVLAMVGSKDYFGKSAPENCVSGKNCRFEGNFNVATAPRQPGSSFKPYVYLTAFTRGFTPETQMWDVDTNFSPDSEKDYNPKNYDGKNHGPLEMKDALAMSLNVPAVQTLYLAGVKESIDMAKSLGITTLNGKPDQYGLSLVLGGGEVTLLDHVSAYATLATGGIRHDKTAVLKIIDSSGEVLEQYQDSAGQRVVEEKHIAMLDYIMSTNDLRAPVFGKNNPLSFSDRQVAAKTGTTNDWHDGWTMGYTPSIAAGVWAGNNDNAALAQGADGVYVAAPIWRSFMDQVLKNQSIEKFPEYEKEDGLKDILRGKQEMFSDVKVCSLPGKKNSYCLATDACPESYRKSKEFFTGHSILWYVDKNDPRGDAPKDPKSDPQFKEWEKAVEKWVDKNKDKSSPPEKECKNSDFDSLKPTVKISSPGNSSTQASPFTISVSGSSPFGIENISLFINGSKVASTDNPSLSHSYSSSGSGSLDIKAEIKDKNDNTESTSISVNVAIP